MTGSIKIVEGKVIATGLRGGDSSDVFLAEPGSDGHYKWSDEFGTPPKEVLAAVKKSGSILVSLFSTHAQAKPKAKKG